MKKEDRQRERKVCGNNILNEKKMTEKVRKRKEREREREKKVRKRRERARNIFQPFLNVRFS